LFDIKATKKNQKKPKKPEDNLCWGVNHYERLLQPKLGKLQLQRKKKKKMASTIKWVRQDLEKKFIPGCVKD